MMTNVLTLVQRKQRWQNQSYFLEHRHGPRKSTSPELILVHLPVAPSEAFDLLCWTINMAACPRDSVIALGQGVHLFSSLFNESST